jgi:hypothetical protein
MDRNRKQRTDRKSPEQLAEQKLPSQMDLLLIERQTDLLLLLKLVEQPQNEQRQTRLRRDQLI